METYREQIIECINGLWQARINVFGSILSIAMTHHMKDIHDSFDIGNVFEFEYAHFEDIEDESLQQLIILSKSMDDTINHLMHVNGIGKDEVDLD
ncbi:MAG: hypothetical protein ACXIUD_02185 [Mongoliitalea sp.]